MVGVENWDWETGEKVIAVGPWKQTYRWVEEYQVSPDGEKIAAVVNQDEGEFRICVNGKPWEGVFDKAWYLRFAPDGRLTALVSEMGEWTVAVDGSLWENKFGYVWNSLFSRDGRHIAVAFQQDMRYGMALDDVCWPSLFVNLSHASLSPDGRRAAASVQLEALQEGQIHRFQEGTYSVADNGQPWENCFVNVWRIAHGSDGRLAAEVRINLYEYTIAVDGQCWDKTFETVWEPVANPVTGAVVAPVRRGGQWELYQDGSRLWDGGFVQLWHQKFSASGDTLAAIVALSFGKWTVAVDGRPWPVSFGDLMTDLSISDDGVHTAALGKDGDTWRVVVDGGIWSNAFDMAWKPVFSPGGEHVAVKVEKGGGYTLAVDDHLWSETAEALFDPVFNSDGSKLLVKALQGGKYHRRVVPVTELTG